MWGLTAALYLTAFPYHPGLRSPNELCRLWQSRAIVEDGRLDLNGVIQRDGMVGDLSRVETPEPPGVKLYPSKAPLLSFLGVPVYAVLKAALGRVSDVRQVYWSRLFFVVLPSLFGVWLLRRFLRRRLEAAWADTLAVVYAVGTLAFSYAETYMSHQLTAVLLFAAFYAAQRTLEGAWRPRGWLLVGALSGLAVLNEYTAALTVVVLAAWVVLRCLRPLPGQAHGAKALPLAVGLVVLSSAPFLGALMAYHTVCFGGPLESGYKHLNDAGYQGWHLGGFLGIRFPDARAFVLSFFSPLRGFFTLSPALLLGVLGLPLLRRGEATRGLFSLTVMLLVANAYFTSSFTYDSWGWCVGPRHLTPLVPFLVLPAGLWLEARERSSESSSAMLLGLGLGLAVSSVLAMGLVGLHNYVPDDVSTSLFGLVLPVYRDGFLPPTLLWLLGLDNPLSGLAVLLELLALVVLLSWRFLGSRPGPVVVAAAAAVAVHLGLLALATTHDEHDVGAVHFLESVWLAPPR
ncbi:MAG: hypothetical protein K1X89_08920 [Myxococcaceae bacterium]|nr:hypothetical protein [Myxococcaceae bacterium]